MNTTLHPYPDHALAVVGLAARLPEAPNLEAFLANLRAGRSAIRPLSEDELRASGVPDSVLADPGYVRYGAFLEDIAGFDAPFFGMSASEARSLDPQQRIFLECAWEALEGAGYDPLRVPGIVGVYGSSATSSYLFNNILPTREGVDLGRYGMSLATVQMMFGNDKDYLATRVAYKLNLRGPALTVASACSSSLLAVHLACQSLLSGECDLALAGGVSVKVPHQVGYFHEEGSIMAPDGQCRPFDREANGTVFGNGCGVVLLKRLEDALEDGDPIHALVLGSAVNNDGSLKMGYSAPSVEAQAQVVADALAVAGIKADALGYVETHGTGTSLGDPVEIAALSQAFRRHTPQRGFCAIGSTKGSIGHLEVASGIASFIKLVLSLKHRELYPSVGFRQASPELGLAESPFFVNGELRPWPEGAHPRRGSVGSLGVGGTNVHVVLQEPPVPAPPPASQPKAAPWLLLSGRTEGALEAVTRRLDSYWQEHPEVPAEAIAATLARGRTPLTWRRAVLASCPSDLHALFEGGSTEAFTDQALDPAPSVAFLFPGQGSQYVQAAQGLLEHEPEFARQLARCAEAFRPHLSLDLREVLYPEAGQEAEATRRLEQTALAQPVLFSLSYALAQTLMAYGIKPAVMLGHSIGELAAACLAEVFRFEDAVRLVAERGRLMQAMPPGAMLSVEQAEADLLPRLGPNLSLAAVNEASRCVVSGPSEAIEALAASLSQEAIPCRRLHVSHAFHSAMMDPAAEAFGRIVAGVERQAPRIPFLSCVTGDFITVAQAKDPEYWARQLRQAVRFHPALQRLLEDPHRVLVEVGAGEVLTALGRNQSPHLRVSTTRHPQRAVADGAHFDRTLARLWTRGVSIQWKARYPINPHLALPTYPFQRTRHWIEAPGQKAPASSPAPEAAPTAAPVPVSLDARTEALLHVWKECLGADTLGPHDNFFDLGGDSVIAIQIASKAQRRGLAMSPKLLFEHQTVAQLAQALETSGALELTLDPEAPVPLSPIQRWLLDRPMTHVNRWAASMLLEPDAAVRMEDLEAALSELVAHHDVLRLRLSASDLRPSQESHPRVTFRDLSHLDDDTRGAALEQLRDELAAGLDLERGPVLQACLVQTGESGRRLLLVLHHFYADNATQRLLLGDLEHLLQCRLTRQEPVLLKTSPYAAWIHRVWDPQVLEPRPDPWLALGERGLGCLAPAEDRGLVTLHGEPLSAEATHHLTEELQRRHRCEVGELLLSALTHAWRITSGGDLLVDLEGEGRELHLPGLDLSRTAGWLTTLFPLRLEGGAEIGATIQQVKTRRRAIPNEGLDHGLLRYGLESTPIRTTLEQAPTAPVFFTYLGHLEVPRVAGALLQPAPEWRFGPEHLLGAFHYPLELITWLQEGRLHCAWSHHGLDPASVDRLRLAFEEALARMLDHGTEATQVAPCDFPEAQLNQEDLDDLMAELEGSL